MAWVVNLRPDDAGGARLGEFHRHRQVVAAAMPGPADDVVDVQHPAGLLRLDLALVKSEYGALRMTNTLRSFASRVITSCTRPSPMPPGISSPPGRPAKGITATEARPGLATPAIWLSLSRTTKFEEPRG